MSNDYYNPSGTPSTGAQGASSPVRSEFSLLQAGFDLLPGLSGNGAKVVHINAGGTAQIVDPNFTYDGLNLTIYGRKAGYRGVPQNSKSTAYTTVLDDAGRHIFHPAADTTARTWTIDSNANVPYDVGTAITFINETGAGTITIAITSDTLALAGSVSTGSRTLAAGGMATAIKVTTTKWMISGPGLS